MKLVIIFISLVLSFNAIANEEKKIPVIKKDPIFFDQSSEKSDIEEWLNELFSQKYWGKMTDFENKMVLERYQAETKKIQDRVFRLTNKEKGYFFLEKQANNALENANNISEYIPNTERGNVATKALITTLKIALGENDIYKNNKFRVLYNPLTGDGFDVEMEIVIKGRPYSLILKIEEKEKRFPIFKKR